MKPVSNTFLITLKLHVIPIYNDINYVQHASRSRLTTRISTSWSRMQCSWWIFRLRIIVDQNHCRSIKGLSLLWMTASTNGRQGCRNGNLMLLLLLLWIWLLLFSLSLLCSSERLYDGYWLGIYYRFRYNFDPDVKVLKNLSEYDNNSIPQKIVKVFHIILENIGLFDVIKNEENR